jgi:hypothetical protein
VNNLINADSYRWENISTGPMMEGKS